MTASQPIVTSSQRRLGFRDGLCDAVTPPYFGRDGLLWRCHQFASVKLVKSFWVQAVTLVFCLHDAVTLYVLTPSLSFDLVNFRVFLRFHRFPHFFTPKTPESAPFVISSPKTPKMRKETTLGEIQSNNAQVRTQTDPLNRVIFRLITARDVAFQVLR